MKIRRSWLLAIGVTLLALAAGVASAGPKDSKIDASLMALHAEHAAYAAQTSRLPFASSNPVVRVVDERVVIDAVADSDVPTLKADLASLGMSNVAMFGRVISGELPIAAIPTLDAISSLRFVRPAYAVRSVGAVTSQGDQAMRADAARAVFGVNGAGVQVGVLSDSFNCLNGASADVTSGDLPAFVQVIQEVSSCAGAADEGRAVLQIVHDVAPGASLAFASAFNGLASFANNILALRASGAGVIVDDIAYPTEPFFQDGIVAQAVDTAVASGAAYFSAAGNNARESYESIFRAGRTFTPGQFGSLPGAPPFLGGTAHNFASSGAADHMQRITIPSGATFLISLQWDSPFASVCIGCPGSPNDVDVYLLDSNSRVVAGAIAGNIGGDPVEVLVFTNFGPTADFNLMIMNFAGPLPGFIKYVQLGSLSIAIAEFNTASGTAFGHPNAAGAVAVGAAAWFDTPAFGVNSPLLEPFSSAGPIPILFDTAGNRLPNPIFRAKPEVVAPDRIDTTMSLFTPFPGTSAAASHAAGVAALMLSRQPALAPAAIYSALEGTAIDMGPPGFDYDSGFGLVQADAALRCAGARSLGQSRDFDGNCKADILWRNSSGLLFTWSMNGTSVTSAGSPGSVSTDWTVVGAGDFNGDGNADILWRHSSGVVYIWLMDGTGVIGAGSPGSVSTDWSIVGVGDFNGDGKADILWRHSSGVLFIWFMDGTNVVSIGSPGGVSTDWTIAGIGDFNGDGKADILWRHSSGVVYIWLMNGTSRIGAGSPGSIPLDWTIVGVGDFNGDGKADILWRHTSGVVYVWLMNGTGIAGAGSPGSVGLDWTIQKAFDFDGDGKADILWRHSSGIVFIWLMNGTSVSRAGSPGSPDLSWTIQ